jgi:hypothetical protein
MMRPLGIGLAAALLMAALVGASTALTAPKDTSATDVPPLIQAGNVPCTVSGTRFIDQGQLADKANAKFYEVSCQEGLGYVIIARDKAPMVQFEDCLLANAPAADGKPSKLRCTLPGNANPTSAMNGFTSKGGRACDVDKARSMGMTPEQTVYEVSCKGGAGYILLVPRKAGGVPSANPCIGYDEANANIKCELTTAEQRSAYLNSLVAASGKACTVKGSHYVGSTSDHSDYIEIACADGKGFMMMADNAGKYKQAVDCANASGIAGGCTLTDSRQAQTEQNGTYGDLAKKAGFDCKVSKYASFATATSGSEIVELQCSNRPDGGIGIFPARGAPRVLDCIRSQTEGYKCSFSPESAVYARLNAQLKAKGRSSCSVSGARPFGRTTTGEDLVEVSCADGGPGWVLQYPASGSDQPSTLLNCTQAAAMGGAAGGCKLPTNMKH